MFLGCAPERAAPEGPSPSSFWDYGFGKAARPANAEGATGIPTFFHGQLPQFKKRLPRTTIAVIRGSASPREPNSTRAAAI